MGWLSQQNGGQFDPQLFNEYREPQENVLANTAFDDSFFNDAFEMDFTTPYNIAPTQNLPKKKNLIAEIDARKETEDTITISNNDKLLTCSNIWYGFSEHSTPESRTLLMQLIGRNYKSVQRCKMAIWILMGCVQICRRRPNVAVLGLLLTSTTSRRS